MCAPVLFFCAALASGGARFTRSSLFYSQRRASFPRRARAPGDRVVTDPMCKPFSMGRNLFCVHSKKHMGDDPVAKAAKMETNRKTLVAMQRRLNEGGCLMWIAPSGGRDRRVVASAAAARS